MVCINHLIHRTDDDEWKSKVTVATHPEIVKVRVDKEPSGDWRYKITTYVGTGWSTLTSNTGGGQWERQ